MEKFCVPLYNGDSLMMNSRNGEKKLMETRNGSSIKSFCWTFGSPASSVYIVVESVHFWCEFMTAFKPIKPYLTYSITIDFDEQLFSKKCKNIVDKDVFFLNLSLLG